MLAEREVWRGIAEGLNAVMVNPSMILGSGDWNAGTAKFFQLIDNGLRFYTPGISAYVSVHDVSDVMFKLMNSPITAERFILAENSYSFKQIFSWIAESIEVSRPQIATKKWMAEIVWRLSTIKSKLTGIEQTITKETARSAFQTSYYDNSKIKAALNYEFTPIQKVIFETGKKYLADKAKI
jgi:dihydroflavonol-4-reductase